LLHLSQPTITLHIKDLEELLGVSLLDRHTRKVAPSKAGKVVYKYGKEIISLVKQMEKELEFFKDENLGTIEVGGSTIPGQYFLPKIIKNFSQAHPGISIFLRLGDSKKIVDAVVNGEIDIGMIGAIFNQKSISYKPCFKDEIVLIAPPDVEKIEITPEDVCKVPLIKREEGSGTWKNVLDAFEKAGVDTMRFNIIGEMGSTEAIKEAVKAGLGWGFVSKLAIELEESLGLVKVIPVKGLRIERKFYLIHLKGKKLTPAESKFTSFIEQFSC